MREKEVNRAIAKTLLIAVLKQFRSKDKERKFGLHFSGLNYLEKYRPLKSLNFMKVI